MVIVDPPVTAPANVLEIGDLDFLHATTPKWLFTITMRTQDGSSVDATMEIWIDVFLQGEDPYFRAVHLMTDPFSISPTRTITNIDLGRTIAVPVYTVDGNARRRLEESALPGGTVPSGGYAFNVVVTPVGGTPTPPTVFTITLTNPSSVELLFPSDGDQSVNEFPLFQWLWDGADSEISIYEKLPGQSSLEEVVSGVPHLSRTLQTKSFQYPSSGVRALIPGKTYVWFVKGLAGVAGGTQAATRSVLRSFSVASGGRADYSALLEELERVLGPRYKSLFDQIRAEGLSPSETIRLNGSQISTAELLELLNLFRADQELVNSVRLE
jgi:hypothetical protein